MKHALDDITIKEEARKGRGAVGNAAATRFENETRIMVDDGWQSFADDEAPKLETILGIDSSRTVITKQESSDIPFAQSMNPYRGCEHGCIYCYARPSHAYLGLSPGLDFESRLFYKPDAPQQLRAELAKPSYKPQPILIGSNTDVYQPVERTLKLTRHILEVLAETKHPFTIITKSALILRDLDILAPLAAQNLVSVCVSLTTLSPELHRIMEPRAARPDKRLAVMRGLSNAGVPVAVLTSPLIPAINDHEIEALLHAAHDHGARYAAYSLLRLAYELKDLFSDWLQAHFPDRAEKVLNHLRSAHQGKLYHAEFGTRHRGTGAYATMLNARFHLAARKLGFHDRRQNSDGFALTTAHFQKPEKDARQMRLFE